MNLFEKNVAFVGGLLATGISILSGISLIKYLVSIESLLINTTTQSSGCIFSMYFFFFVSLVLAFLAWIDASENEMVQTVIATSLITNFLTSLAIALFTDSFWLSFLFFAKIDLINLSIALIGGLSLSSIAFLFVSKKLYQKIKSKMSTFFNNKKTQKEQIKKSINELEENTFQHIEKNYSLTIFNNTQNVSKEMSENFEKLKEMVEYLKTNAEDVKIQSEIQMLIDNTLPKVCVLYEKAKTKENKAMIESTLSNVVLYFTKLTEEMKTKEEYKNTLDLETEVSYMNQKYLSNNHS